MTLHATFTDTFTGTFARDPFTVRRNLHAAMPGERVSTFTDTFTPFTLPDLHARTPLYRGGRVGRQPIITTSGGPR